MNVTLLPNTRGDLTNILAEQLTSSAPALGMPVTRLGYTDRDVFNIVDVLDARTLRVARRGREVVITRRSNGQWRERGCGRGHPVWVVGLDAPRFDVEF